MRNQKITEKYDKLRKEAKNIRDKNENPDELKQKFKEIQEQYFDLFVDMNKQLVKIHN